MHACDNTESRVASVHECNGVKSAQDLTQRQAERETDRDRQRQTETDKDRQRQTEIDRDRQRHKEKDRDRQRQIETHRQRDRQRDRQTDRQCQGQLCFYLSQRECVGIVRDGRWSSPQDLLPKRVWSCNKSESRRKCTQVQPCQVCARLNTPLSLG